MASKIIAMPPMVCFSFWEDLGRLTADEGCVQGGDRSVEAGEFGRTLEVSLHIEKA